ncbi:protocatechuate dioxygenase [Rhodococcus aerolatus]
MSRRRALGLGGTVGLGGVLAACGVGGSSTASPGSSSTTTTAAAAASVRDAADTATPTTTTAGTDVTALLDSARTCTLLPEETQGPYWFDVDSIRSDLREDRPGTTLTLALRVNDVTGCTADALGTPVADAVVEIWHCDAGGVYSGFESGSQGGPGGGAPGGRSGGGETSDGSYSVGDTEATTTDDGTYLRGAQVADANGVVQFTTVYPGWYRGRTVHIHLKVHKNRATVLTSQLFFDDTLNDTVFATAPYSSHTGRDTTNATDSIYDAAGLLHVAPEGDGYLAYLNVGVDV